MLGSDGYREGPMSIYPGFKEHCFTPADFGRMVEQGILRRGDPDYLDEGRVVRDAPHEPQRRGAGEYRRDEALGRASGSGPRPRCTGSPRSGRSGITSTRSSGTEIYDPLRPSPMACHIRRMVDAQFRDLDGFRRIDGLERWVVGHYCPLTLREGFLPNPDMLVFPDAFLRGKAWPPAAEYPLVIEVEGPEIPGNKAFKFAEYASAGVEEFWLVSRDQGRVEIYRKGNYDPPEIVRSGQSIPLTFLGADPPRISVEEIFR